MFYITLWTNCEVFLSFQSLGDMLVPVPFDV